MTICRYAGLDQKVKFGTLEASHVVSGAELSDFVGLSDRQAVENGASFGCPMSQGSVDLLSSSTPRDRRWTCLSRSPAVPSPPTGRGP